MSALQLRDIQLQPFSPKLRDEMLYMPPTYPVGVTLLSDAPRVRIVATQQQKMIGRNGVVIMNVVIKFDQGPTFH